MDTGLTLDPVLADLGLKPAWVRGLPPNLWAPRLSVTQLWWRLATRAARSYDSPASGSRGESRAGGGALGLPLPAGLTPPPSSPSLAPSFLPFTS